MPASFSSHAEVIDALGVAVLAKGLSKKDSHVRTMKVRNSIPKKFWSKVEKIAAANEKRRITVKLLQSIAPVPKPRGRAVVRPAEKSNTGKTKKRGAV